MTINRYRANSLKAAIEMANAELGPNAKILHVKQIRNEDGQTGKLVEIIVAVDDQSANEHSLNNCNKVQEKEARKDRDVELNDQPLSQQMNRYGAYNAHTYTYKNDERISTSKLDEPVDELLIQMKHLWGSANIPSSEEQALEHDNLSLKNDSLAYEYKKNLSSVQETKAPKGYQQRSKRSKITQALHECLVKNGVDTEIMYEILSLLNDDRQIRFKSGKEPEVLDYLSLFISENLKMVGGLKKKVSILIGPTGVGKTTTLAKLAAQYHLKHEKLKIGIITIDAYRIAAIDQLKTYAHIMSIPLKVALTPEQLERCIQSYQDMDLILVDTPGRSQLNKIEIHNIEEFLEAAQPADIKLLIPASLKDSDAYNVIENFAPSYVHDIIFTKLDETQSFGSIINVCVKSKKPLSYFTIGQNVPDDIRLADENYLAELLVSGSVRRYS